MVKLYMPILALAATFCTSAEAQTRKANYLSGYAALAADASQSLLQRVVTWGDWMGADTDFEEPMPTSVVEYFYDNSNRLQSTLEYSYLAGNSDTTWDTEQKGDKMYTQYVNYTYDANGNLVRATSRKFGTYDMLFTAWENDSSVVENNMYDENNHLIYQYSYTGGIHKYTWSGNNLIEKVDTSYTKGTWSKTTQYLDFLEGAENCPQTALSVDTYKQKYKSTYTYDEQGRALTCITYQVKSATVDADHHMSDIVLKDNPYSKEEWTYDEHGIARYTRAYWNNSAADYVYTDGEQYTTEEDGGRKTQQIVWNSETNDWALFGSSLISYNSEFTANSAPTNLTASLVADKLNTVSVTADLPADATDADTWKVYRNNVYVADAEIADGKLTFTDADLKNNTYEYFIQRGEGNVSNAATVVCAIEFNAPQNLRVVSLKKKSTSNGDNYTVNFKWDAPEPMENGLELTGYNIYSDLSDEDAVPVSSSNYAYKPLSTDTQEYTYTWSAVEDYSHTIYVEAIYGNYGRVKALPLAFRLGETAEKVLYSSNVMGDAMGSVGDDVATKVTRYYYDTNKRLVREVQSARLSGDNENTPDIVEQAGDYQASLRYMYEYDKKGNLTTKLRSNYGVYSGYNFSWTEPDTLEKYSYDDNSKCVKKVDESYTTEYTWDGNNLTSEKQSITGGAWRSTTNYSDFVEGFDNLPQLAVKNGQYTSNQRIIEMTYDANGNMLTRKTYKIAEKQTDADGNITEATKGDIEYSDAWTYDEEGDATLYLRQKWNSSSQALVDYQKTEYTKQSNGILAVSKTYSASSGTWTSSGRPILNVYRDIYKNTTATNFKVTKDDSKLNTVVITAGRPTDCWDDPVYYIYRNGENLGKATVSPRRTTLSFTDSIVPNGTWDYYIEADTRTANIATTITTPVTVVFDTELAPVTNMWADNASKSGNYYKMTVHWDAPESKIPITGYNIYADVKSYTKNPAPDNGTEFLTDTSYDYEWSTEGESTRNIYVETVYVIGRIKSETKAFDALVIAGIDNATNIAADANFTLNGRTLLVNGDYSKLSVYGTSGSLCGEFAGANTVNLSTLPQGVYVVKMVKADGHESVKKLVLK